MSEYQYIHFIACERYDYLNDVHSFLRRLAPLREMLMQGDLRPLYLVWLACAYDDESPEPPVPAGLTTLDDSMEALAEFYETPFDLLEAAADQSLPEPENSDRNVAAEKWIKSLSKVDLQQIVRDVATGDATSVRCDLLDNIRKASPVESWPTTGPSRTLGELRALAETVAQKREERERMENAKDRKRYLTSIAADPTKTIRDVNLLVAEKRSASYEEAAQLLNDLAEALGPVKGPAEAKSIAMKFRKDKPQRQTALPNTHFRTEDSRAPVDHTRFPKLKSSIETRRPTGDIRDNTTHPPSGGSSQSEGRGDRKRATHRLYRSLFD